MAKSRPPHAAAAPGNSGSVLREVANSLKQQTDILNRLLAVARFGPQAGGGGLPGRAAAAGSPEDRAAQVWRDRQALLYNQAQGVSQIGLGSIAGGIAGQASVAQGFKTLGLPGANFLQSLVPFTGTGLGLLNSAARAAPTLHDSFLTGEQKARKIADLIPGVSTAKVIYEDLTGRKQQMERLNVEHQQRVAAEHGELRRLGFEASYNPQQAALEARSRGLAGAAPVLEGYTDRSTAVGEKEFQDKQRRLPVEREIAKAERETAAASAQRLAAERELAKLQQRGNDLQKDRRRLEEDLKNEGSGPRRQNVLNRIKETEEAISGTANLRQQSLQAVAGAREAEARAKFSAGAGRVRLLQADAADLEEEAARAAGGARHLGGINRFHRVRGVQALANLQRFGPDALFPEQIAAASSLAPQTVAKILEKRGAETPEFTQLRELAPADYAGSPEDLRRQASEKRDEAVRRELELERTLAASSADAGKRLGDAVLAAMREVVDSAVRTIKTDILRAKAPT